MIWLVAVIAGACWRRFWGDERPAWAFRGYRATQAVAGVAVLFGLGLWTGEPWWRAALDAGIAIGWLTLPIKVSLFGFTQIWKWVDARWGTPAWGRWFTGYTTYAEATAGGSIWLLAVAV